MKKKFKIFVLILLILHLLLNRSYIYDVKKAYVSYVYLYDESDSSKGWETVQVEISLEDTLKILRIINLQYLWPTFCFDGIWADIPEDECFILELGNGEKHYFLTNIHNTSYEIYYLNKNKVINPNDVAYRELILTLGKYGYPVFIPFKSSPFPFYLEIFH